jgi:hypothetical protein
MAKRLMVLLLAALLASAGYAARNTHLMKHWHPMLVEPALGHFGLSFFGHEHNTRVYRVEDGSFVEAPVTSCGTTTSWNATAMVRTTTRLIWPTAEPQTPS